MRQNRYWHMGAKRNPLYDMKFQWREIIPRKTKIDASFPRSPLRSSRFTFKIFPQKEISGEKSIMNCYLIHCHHAWKNPHNRTHGEKRLNLNKNLHQECAKLPKMCVAPAPPLDLPPKTRTSGHCCCAKFSSKIEIKEGICPTVPMRLQSVKINKKKHFQKNVSFRKCA